MIYNYSPTKNIQKAQPKKKIPKIPIISIIGGDAAQNSIQCEHGSTVSKKCFLWNRIKVSPLTGLVGFTGTPIAPWVKTHGYIGAAATRLREVGEKRFGRKAKRSATSFVIFDFSV